VAIRSSSLLLEQNIMIQVGFRSAKENDFAPPPACESSNLGLGSIALTGHQYQDGIIMNVGLAQVVGNSERCCTAQDDLDLVLFVLVKMRYRPPLLFLPDLVLIGPVRFFVFLIVVHRHVNHFAFSFLERIFDRPCSCSISSEDAGSLLAGQLAI
jgi:hypothetical protein